MEIKPNCKKCYYGGMFRLNEGLATCDAPFPKEPTVIKYDDFRHRERRFVKRKNWDDECECANFIPRLSEMEGDFELESECTFSTSFNCPFCGENVDVYGLGIEETRIEICPECAKEIAVRGKAI